MKRREMKRRGDEKEEEGSMSRDCPKDNAGRKRGDKEEGGLRGRGREHESGVPKG